MFLTDIEIKKAKPDPGAAAPKKRSGGRGLQLWVQPDGAKYWRLAYRFDGKQRTISLGVYPKTGLKEAREAREAAKKLLAGGRDPSIASKVAKVNRVEATANTFDAIAAELRAKKGREGKALGTVVMAAVWIQWRDLRLVARVSPNSEDVLPRWVKIEQEGGSTGYGLDPDDDLEDVKPALAQYLRSCRSLATGF